MMDRIKHNLGLKVIAALFAVLLWWAVMNIDDPINVKNYTVDVTVTNEDVITNVGKSYQVLDDTKEVVVTVKARRRVLSRIKKKNIVATADLREMQDTSVPIRVTIMGFEGEYEEVVANPRNIQVKTENILKKTFPITPVSVGNTREGCVVGSMSVSPKSVDISGPESTIARISKVVAQVDVSEMSNDGAANTKLTYLDGADNVIDQSLLTSNCDKNGVTVSVKIWKTKTVNLEFDTSGIKAAEGFAFAGIEAEPQSVVIAGAADVLGSTESIRISSDALASSGLKTNRELMVELVSYLPEGIVLVDADTGRVAVRIMIEKAGTKTLRIPVGSVETVGTPTGLKSSNTGGSQEVALRFEGSKEALDKLTAEKITATVDLSPYDKAGTYDVPVKITHLPEGCTYIDETTIRVVLTKN